MSFRPSRILSLILLVWFVLSGIAAHADAPSFIPFECDLSGNDSQASGVARCPKGDPNDGINTVTTAVYGPGSPLKDGDYVAYAARSGPGSAVVPIDAFGTCRWVDNAGSGDSARTYFIPFKTKLEWTSFLDAVAGSPGLPGVSLVPCAEPYLEADPAPTVPPSSPPLPTVSTLPPYANCAGMNLPDGTASGTINKPILYGRLGQSFWPSPPTIQDFTCHDGATSVTSELQWSAGNPAWQEYFFYSPDVILTATDQLNPDNTGTNITIYSGDSVELDWAAAEPSGSGLSVKSCLTGSSPADANWSGDLTESGKVLSGGLTVAPAVTTAYTLTCTGPGNPLFLSARDLSSTATVTVTVLSACGSDNGKYLAQTPVNLCTDNMLASQLVTTGTGWSWTCMPVGGGAAANCSATFVNIVLMPETLPAGTQNTPYSQTITASGGTAPYTYTVTTGALPPGLSLNGSTGVIAGTPTTPGTSSFTVTATDAHGYTGARAYSIGIDANGCPSGQYVWTERTSSSSQSWYRIAMSNDGKRLAAVTRTPDYIYTSADFGVTWTQRTAPGSHLWSGITSSSDGMRLAAVMDDFANIWTSTDGGETWTQRAGPGPRWFSAIASSSDGSHLAAAVHNIDSATGLDGDADYIYTSVNGGATWTQRTNAGARWWYNTIASSSDGSHLAASGYDLNGDSYIYTSTDSGATWTQRTSAGSRWWKSIASSSDGSHLAAVVVNGYIYTSTDGGTTWTQRTSAGSRAWYAIASSNDGNHLAATVSSGNIWTTVDGGATWIQQTSAGTGNWMHIVSSSDASNLATAKVLGYIWTGICSGADGGTEPGNGGAAVNGRCGSANGVAVSSAPTSNLCSAGTASAVTGSGPWTWTCAGSNGGSDASCSAPAAAAFGCGGTMVGGYCWYYTNIYATCTTICANHGGCNLEGTRNYAGSGGTNAHCKAVLDALFGSSAVVSDASVHTTGGGCGWSSLGPRERDVGSATTCEAYPWDDSSHRRACACNN